MLSYVFYIRETVKQMSPDNYFIRIVFISCQEPLINCFCEEFHFATTASQKLECAYHAIFRVFPFSAAARSFSNN